MSSPAFAIATAARDALDAELSRLSAALKVFPSGPMGITPDAVKFSPEFRAAKSAFDAAFHRLRAFNAEYHRTFKAEILAARRARVAS